MNRGSGSQGSAQPTERRRFNEAPIHESGKLRRLHQAHQSDTQASMRPRFMNRGSLGRDGGAAMLT